MRHKLIGTEDIFRKPETTYTQIMTITASSYHKKRELVSNVTRARILRHEPS